MCLKLAVYGSGSRSPNKARPGLYICASTLCTQILLFRPCGFGVSVSGQTDKAPYTTRHNIEVLLNWRPRLTSFCVVSFRLHRARPSTLAWVSCCSLWRSSFGEVTLPRKNTLPSNLILLFLAFTQISGLKQVQITRLSRKKDTNPWAVFYSGVCWCVFFGQLPPVLSSVSLSLSLSLSRRRSH